MSRGALILFEGVDRCGKTTQAKKLVDALSAGGSQAVLMRFPDRETTIGKMINAYLKNSTELDDRAVHLLFAANRWEKLNDILSALRSGKHVVMDRYAFSGVAFSSAKPGMDLEWCKQPDAGLPLPDAVVWMELPVEAAAERGGFGGERYEKEDFQAKVRMQFSELREQCNVAAPGVWRDCNAAGTIDEVHERVLSTVSGALTRAAAGEALRRLWDGALL